MNDPLSHQKLACSPPRWGLPRKAIRSLARRLHHCWQRYQKCFQTRTRDTSDYAFHYLSAQLRMEADRNFAQMARKTQIGPQNLQHFMSHSPWKARAVIEQVHAEIANTPALLLGSVLLLDESGEEKASNQSVGCARQYNGRQGKVDMSQMGVFLALANLNVNLWSWVDADLYLPKPWFEPDKAALKAKLGVPSEREFATKWQLGLAMILRAHAHGLPFEMVACDAHYGQCRAFRHALDQAGILYCADVGVDERVFLACPTFGVPPATGKGRPPEVARVLEGTLALTVAEVGLRADTLWQTVRVRPTERGYLQEPFAFRRVWTVRDGSAVQEWLILRQESGHKISYALSNAAPDTSVDRLAWSKCVRYFVERSNQDAKSELGYDEFTGQRWLAWQHHVALTILSCWFVAHTKLEWSHDYPRDPLLASEWEVDVLPALSTANVRELLRATMPLPQLSEDEAALLVVTHLVNRTLSRKSRLKHRKGVSPPN
jgi:SRSO17 transposase